MHEKNARRRRSMEGVSNASGTSRGGSRAASSAGSRFTNNFPLAGVIRTLLFLLLFFLPLFYLPFSGVPLVSAKGALLGTVAFLGFFFFILSAFRTQTFVFSRSVVWVGLILWVLVAFISAVFSSAPAYSLFGRGIELGTFLVTTALVMITFLFSQFFARRKQVQSLILAFFAVFFIIFVFHLVRIIFGPGVLTLGYFTGVYTSLLGGWYDLPIFFGFGALLGMVSVTLLWGRRIFRIFACLITILSLLALAVFPLDIVLILLATSSFLLLSLSSIRGAGIRSFMPGPRVESDSVKRVPDFLYVTVLVVTVLLLIFSGPVSGFFSRVTGIDETSQVSPSIKSTIGISEQTWGEGFRNKIIGTGPGNFYQSWAKYKSSAIYQTEVWAADFHSGSGFLPTRAVTLGGLGVLAILIVLVGILIEGKRGLFPSARREIPAIKREFFFAIYLPLVYLWVLLLFSSPGIVMVFFAFVFLGIMLGFLGHEKFIGHLVIRNRTSKHQGDARYVIFIVVFVIGVFGSLFGIYKTTQQIRGEVYAKAGEQMYKTGGDLDQARKLISHAISVADVDTYYRSRAELGVQEMEQIAQQSGISEAGIDTDRLEQVFQASIADAQKASELDPANYHNWIFLGDLYRFFAKMGISGAYDLSRSYYKQSLNSIPNSPLVNLNLGKLEITQENTHKGADYIGKALKIKPGYIEASLVLAKIQIADGEKTKAVETLIGATKTMVQNPDPSQWFEAGKLLYTAESYDDAEQALKNALILAPQYSNAQYYLGLTYAKNDQKKQALTVLQKLHKKYPENQQLSSVISKIESGEDTLSEEETAPVDVSQAPEPK